MCGIIHCKKTNKNESANRLVIKRFEKQRTRGTQGFGYVELKNGYVVSEVRTRTEDEAMKKLNKSEADEILFHHRLPTSTPNIIESTHPILVSNDSLEYDYYVVHNGVISNDDELRAEHIKQGFEYTTDLKKQFVSKKNIYEETLWNDSEAVAIDFCLAIEKGKEMTSKGSIAIVALQFEKTSGKAIALYFGRNAGNPLKIENDKSFLSISSETGKDLDTDKLYRYDYATKKITDSKMKIGDYYNPMGYQSWQDYDWYKNYNKGKTNTKDEDLREDLEEEYYDEEEEDFFWEEEEAKQELENEITQALIVGDTALATQLREDLEDLEAEIEERRLARKAILYGADTDDF